MNCKIIPSRGAIATSQSDQGNLRIFRSNEQRPGVTRERRGELAQQCGHAPAHGLVGGGAPQRASLVWGENIFIGLIMSVRKLKASREGVGRVLQGMGFGVHGVWLWGRASKVRIQGFSNRAPSGVMPLGRKVWLLGIWGVGFRVESLWFRV